MLRRLATVAVAFSLAATALTSTVAAQDFAKAPTAAARAQWRPADEPPVAPRVAPAARARLRKILAARRAKNIAAFRAYATRGVYPHNYVTSGKLNVWIDEDGHLCAAATMIFQSGAKDLVRKVGRDDKYIRLADVTTGQLMDWMLTSGLTQAEIAAIQEPMMGARALPPEPDPGSQDWRIAEDARLRARYAEVLTMLARDRDTSLDAAIDALAARPDLIATLI
ncbi:MAG TPA: hypothetical protein VM734_16505 [Kofleriaceae bacterium]|jgi:hypothetical protein|nr:hypothetical protein [Kofleriaceae bacterium]